ncbi:MAG: PCRF domain-containing protein, partial [Myxococcota bacterium]
MLDKLQDVERRFEEVTQQMSDPTVAQDIEALTKLGKERARLEKVVELFRELRDAEGQLAGAKELLNEDDEEMRDMAKAEIKVL